MPPTTRRIGVIAGDVMCTFPERYEALALESLDEGAAVSAGDLELVIERSGEDGCLLRLIAGGDTGKLPRSMIRHLVPTTILGIDARGNEAFARVREMQTYGGNAEHSDVRVGVGFDAEGFGPLRALRLQLATGAVHRLYPVRFENVAVP